jgi:hypothetical protein
VALIKVPTTLYPVSISGKALEVETWCETNIGYYGSGWYWVAAFDDYILLRISDDINAIMFKLAFQI